MKPVMFLRDLGSNRAYETIWQYQEVLLQENVAKKSALKAVLADTLTGGSEAGIGADGANNYLLFVEHKPVYTLGKSGHISNVLISDDERSARGIEFFRINRGGDITFHGPGQLVGYPILDLEQFRTDLGWYLRSLEEVIILTLAEYGIAAGRSIGETGVWIDAGKSGFERKICAMGIRCSRWITMHGFAFNINTNLDYFSHIIPCGIQHKQVTSLQKELGYEVVMEEVKTKVAGNFEKVFDLKICNDK